MIKCKSCGTENIDTAKFCINCGHHAGGIQKISQSYIFNNRYHVEKAIKEGEYGGVFLCRDSLQNAEVVVKAGFLSGMGKEMAEQTRNRFMNETRILLHLSHIALPKMIEFFCEKDKCCLAMQFIRGQDLHAIMKERDNTPLPQGQVLKWLVQLLELLDYMHSHSPAVLLRDLKPSHIMISAGDRLYAVDLGISEIFKPSDRMIIAGSAGFAAPEVYKGFTDHRSDIYSLGAITHYLLTGIDPSSPGVPPFSFESIRQSSPYITESLDNLIMSMLRMKMEDRPQSVRQVITQLQSVFSSTGKSRGLFSRGMAQYNKGEFRQALKTFSRAIVINPDNAKSYLWRGMAYESIGDPDAAAKDYTRALDIDPLYMAALCKRGEIYSQKGENDKALSDFNDAIRLEPDYAEAYKGRGLVNKDMGKFRKAITDFNIAIDIDPGYDEAFLWRGLTYYTLGEFGLAIEDFDRAIEINPEYEDAYMGRALAYDGLGRFDISIGDNTLALEINPDSPSAYYGRGSAYRRSGSPDLALQDLNMAIRLDKEYADAYFERGLVLYEMSRLKEAIDDFSRAIHYDPEYREAYRYRGKSLKRTGRSEEAEKDFEKYNSLS